MTRTTRYPDAIPFRYEEQKRHKRQANHGRRLDGICDGDDRNPYVGPLHNREEYRFIRPRGGRRA